MKKRELIDWLEKLGNDEVHVVVETNSCVFPVVVGLEVRELSTDREETDTEPVIVITPFKSKKK